LVRIRVLKLLVASILMAGVASAQSVLAAHPPMGWNSWDAYGLTITEAQFRDNVGVMAKTLKPFGWQYAVIDEGWFLPNPLVKMTPENLDYLLDANGRYIPVPSRFASAMVGGKNAGFAALGAFVHARRLKFGIHIVRGIPRLAVQRNTPVAGSDFHAQDVADTGDPCPWDPTNWGVRDTPAGQAWYDSLVAQYAAWGVDYLKVDCISDHPYKPAEIRMIHQAIVKSGRAIVLSLSPGPTALDHARELQPLAQMWRISDDVWDFWTNPKPWPRSVSSQFAVLAGWAHYAQPGNWPDADMLPIGYLGPHPGDGEARESRLTHDEQQTLLTLWSIARSPLILGANLTKLDDWTTKLLTNKDVLNVDQNGHDAKQAMREGDEVAWTATGKAGTEYLALFNLGESAKTIERKYQGYKLPGKAYASRELWSNTKAGRSDTVKVTLPAHGAVLLELNP
jgi:hypothetical protein